MLDHAVRNAILTHRMLEAADRVVVAVSGGPDSVALCHLLHRLRHSLEIELVIAHVHHGLRGVQADEDLRFVQDWGASLGLPVAVQHLDVRSWQKEHGGSLQMAARTLRYECLRRVMSQESADRLALGHNADDQAEEILLRLFRGVGQRGLTGMSPCTRDGIIRPLLGCHRHEIMSYIDEHQLAHRQDLSNLEPWCQRNILRLEAIPLLKEKFNTNLTATLLRTASIFQEEEDYWRANLQCWLEVHSERREGHSLRLPIAQLLQTHPALQRRLLRQAVEEIKGDLRGFAFRHTDMLLRLCRSPAANRQVHLPGMLVAEKNYGWLTVAIQDQTPEDFHYQIPGPGFYPLPSLNHTMEVLNVGPSEPIQLGGNPNEVVMDRDRLTFPLFLRSGKPGDRFRPLGLGGSKKVKDYFIDIKTPRSQRRRIPILCSRDHIVWVVGHRLDDRVRITSQTSRRLRICYSKGGKD